jgi:hypothetical protein
VKVTQSFGPGNARALLYSKRHCFLMIVLSSAKGVLSRSLLLNLICSDNDVV